MRSSITANDRWRRSPGLAAGYLRNCPKMSHSPGVRVPRWPALSELAQRARAGTMSPTEMVHESFGRIARLDPVLNAFVACREEDAMVEARASETRIRRGEGRPLEGVPIAIKDNTAVAGLPVTRGSYSSSLVPAGEDAELVARLRLAGAIVVGKTNLPEFGAIPVTESERLSACRNPWDPSLTPGGSSGGSAAAVAAGMVPAAQGNDGGGSLRIPASCCGIFGLKPSRGRISAAPGPGDAGAGLVVPGFLTTRVSDMALLLDIVSGPATGDPYAAPAPRVSFSATLAHPGRRLRVGWTCVPPVEAPVDAACTEAVLHTADVLGGLGHIVEQIQPNWTRPWLALEFRKLWAAGMLANVLGAEPGPDGEVRVEPHIRALADFGRTVNSGELLQAEARLQLHNREVAGLWTRWDVVMTPTLARLPLRVGQLFQDAGSDPLAPMTEADRFTPFTPLVNVTGQPAASIPMHWHHEIPVGVQLIGRLYDEATLLGLCQELETATGWPEASPPAPLARSW
ncbi:MAG: amidase [Candidatus Dormibacteria bacterium]